MGLTLVLCDPDWFPCNCDNTTTVNCFWAHIRQINSCTTDLRKFTLTALKIKKKSSLTLDAEEINDRKKIWRVLTSDLSLFSQIHAHMSMNPHQKCTNMTEINANSATSIVALLFCICFQLIVAWMATKSHYSHPRYKQRPAIRDHKTR